MIKKLILIAFILLNVKVSVALSSSNTPPTITNFKIESSTPDRVYFDSNVPIAASTANGFIINGKTINSITINSGQLTGHYFKVSSSFTFWDNNTIRYEGGSDLKNPDGNSPLYNFTLSYIINNILEPEATTNRYVTISATGGGDGTTEGTAWTWQEAFNNATAGQTVWIKTGNYGNLNLNISGKNGTISSPIKFIGYKNSIGDITSNYYDNYPNAVWSTTEMPTLTGVSPTSGLGIYLSHSNYVVFRNIQITNYYQGLRTPSKNNWNSNIVFDNMNFKEFGGAGFNSGVALGVYTYNAAVTRYVGNTNFKFLNLIMQNYSMGAVHSLGDGINLIKNVKTYNDFTERADYQLTISGDNNIITNCRVENVDNTDNRSTHGIGVRGDIRRDSDYNLIENSIAVNLNESFYIRNYGCEYNVIKDCQAINNNAPGQGQSNAYRGGVALWGGVNYNVIERVTVNDAVAGIIFKDNEGEDGISNKEIGHDNIIRNCTFNNVSEAIQAGTVLSGGVGYAVNNKIINCSFNNARRLFNIYNTTFTNLEITNCTFSDIGVEATNVGASNYYLPNYAEIKFDFCNFYNLGFSTPTSTNSLEVDPQFENASNNNLRLKPESELINKGINSNDLNFDFDGNSRLQGSSYDIGAFEDQSNVPSAGSDITICNGSSTVLTASGGNTYLWDNGETTASITVSPTITTTYSVEITGDTEIITDTVLVTVNESPIANVGADIEICNGSDTILTASGGDTYLWSTGETSNSITVNPTQTTTYSVTASNDGCTTTSVDEVIVTVNSVPNLNAGNDIEICIGGSIALIASGSDNYVWSTGETTASITVNPTTTTTYTVTSTLGNCSISDDVIVTVSNPPSVSLGADTTICYGENITLTAEGNGNFVWSTGETTSSITVNPNTTTNYSVTSTSACDTVGVTDEMIVNVTPEITLDAGNDVTICQGENITLTASGNSAFLWSTGETTASITINPSTTTTYSITSTVGNCSKTDEVIVTVDQAPSINLGTDTAICNGENITLTAEGNGNFVWSTGETTSSISVSPSTTTTYSVTATSVCDTNGVSDEIVITVNDSPSINAGADVTIEKGSSTTLTATGEGDFLWSTGETTSSITVSPTTTTTYTVTATSNSTNCSNEDNVVVTVNDSTQQVVANAGADIEICKNSPNVVLTASGGGTYLWSTGEVTASITVNPTETTIYTVTVSNSISIDTDEVTVFIDQGCSGTGNRNPSTKEILLYPNPTDGLLNIELNGFSNTLNISLYSLNGSMVHSENIDDYSPDKILKRQIDLSRFGKGVYFVRLVNNGEVNTKKILVI